MKQIQKINSETLDLLKSYLHKPKKNIIKVIEKEVTLDFT